MWTISIEYQFEAAHFLTKVPDGHKCKRLHGHNYVVVVECQSDTLDHRDFVIDYFDLRPIKQFLDENWDHRCLNDVVPVETTVENLTAYLWRKFKPQFECLSAIEIRETPTTRCRFEGKEGDI